MTRTGRASWVLLLGAAGLLALANGHWAVPLAAWLAPVLLLLFLESQPAVRGLTVGFIAQLLAFFVNWWDMIPVPGAWYYLVTGIYALIYYVPFVAHRLLAPRLDGFLSTLILPSWWIAMELLLHRLVTP